AAQGTSTISLSGATLAPGTSCTFGVSVKGTAIGQQNNTTSSVTDNAGIPGSSAQASITVVVAPTLTTGFATANLQLNGSTTLRFILTNPRANTITLTGLSFSDLLPAGLLISSPNGLTGSCGSGTITANAGSNNLSLSGAVLAPGASCIFSVNVTSNTL